jgi:hypothetical protein
MLRSSTKPHPDETMFGRGDDIWTWFTAISGIVYVVLAVTALLIGGNDPTPSDSLQTVRAYFVDNRTQVLTSVYVDSLSLAFLLAFAAGLGGLLMRRSADPLGILARLMLAGAVGTVVITMVENMAEAALAYRTSSVGDVSTVQALFDLYMMEVLVTFSIAVFLVAAGMGILRSATLPRWSGWAAFVLALLLVIGGAGLGDPRGNIAAIGFMGGYLPFLLWTLAISVVLVVRRNASVALSHDASAQMAD